jgi:hypothetical protein
VDPEKEDLADGMRAGSPATPCAFGGWKLFSLNENGHGEHLAFAIV